jgi:serine/threonine protein kinase
MNFEELLNVQEGQKPHRESTPLGSYYRRQVDGKYRYVIELRLELIDSIVFCEALKQEQQWSMRQHSKQQLHYDLHQDSSGLLYEVELEQGHFLTLSSLLDQNPAVVAGKGFVDSIVQPLIEYGSTLNDEGVFHLCFSPNNIFVRKSDNHPFLLSHGSFYKGMTDQKVLFADAEDYVAPEVLAGQEATERSDVYSMGKLIAFLYEQGSMPYEYKQVVKKATAEEPKKRYKSLAEMGRAVAQKRNMRRSLLLMAACLIVSLLAVYIYVDMLPEVTNDIEFVEPAQKSSTELFTSDELEEDTAFMADTIDLSDEALMQKAEMIYRKRYQKAADEILSKVYNNKHMGSSEKTFMANSQSMAEELLKVQQELAGEAGLPDGLAGRIGHEIVEQLTQQKQKGLSRQGYIKAKEGEKE